MNQKTSLQKSLFPRFSLKAISLFTVIVFLCSDFLSFPAQAFADQGLHLSAGKAGTTDRSLGLLSPVSGLQSDFVVPPELGTISDAYRGELGTGNGERKNGSVTRSPFAVSRHDRMVVLIQDAHAVPDAQRSLMKLIEHFQSKYGIRQVALEGAEGKLDPGLFRNFPDKEKLAKVFNSYLDSGELSGAAVASVLLPTPTDYVGVEDWDLYQEGVAAFLSGLEKQADLKSQIANLKEKLQELKKKYYASKALEFDAHHEKWRREQDDLAGFLSYLAQTRGFDSKRYPSLNAVVQGLRNESVPENSKLDQEIKTFASRAQAALKNKALVGKFNEISQSLQTGSIEKAGFAYEVSKLVPGASPGMSKELQAVIENHERIVLLQGSEFTREFEKAIAGVKASIFISPEEKETNALSEQVALLEKLVKFELSRKEWEELRSGNGQRGTLNASETIDALQKKTVEFFRSPITADFFRFYEIAMEREKVFCSKLEGLLGPSISRSPFPVSRATNPIVFVAGGFHTEGLAAKLKEKDISYVVVSPKISEIPKDDRYFNYMKGQVSWREYFKPKNGKIDLYDAFARAMVERLTSRGTGNGERNHDIRHTTYDLPPTILKEWRDDVIRTLAAEGRVAEHSKYTRYIDQALVAERPAEMDALKAKWTAQFEQFIEKLQLLGKQNQLTESNIAKLLGQPANQTPAAVASLMPDASVPANFLRDRVQGIGDRKKSEFPELSPKPNPLYPNEVSIPKEAVLDETLVEPSQRSEVRQSDDKPVPAVPATVNAELEKYLAGKTLIHSVFEGGGAKGVAYVGALEELELKNMWFKEVAGTSAGAITASLIAAGYTYPEIKDIVFNTDFNKFKDKRWGFVPPWLNFLIFGGLYRGQAFEEWIAGKLKDKLGFEPQLKDLPIPLTVITSDISNKNMLILDKDTAPGLKVAEAVRMSMGIPFFFEVYRWLGFYKKFPLGVRRVVDGGLLSNFPLFVYDEAGRKGEPVVGFMLQEIPHKKKSSGWISKLLALLKFLPPFHIAIAVIETALDGHDNRHIEDDVWARIVHIPVDVGTLDFDLTLEQKKELAERGKEATKKILGQALRGEKGKYTAPEAGQTVTFRSKGSRVFFKPAGFTDGIRFDYLNFYRDRDGNFQANVRFRFDKRVLIQPRSVWDANYDKLRSRDGKWNDAALAGALKDITKNTVFSFNTELARDFVLFDPRTKQESTVKVADLSAAPENPEYPVLVLNFSNDIEIVRTKGNVEIIKNSSITAGKSTGNTPEISTTPRSEMREEDKALAKIHEFARIAKEQVREFAKQSIVAKQRMEWELRRHGKIKNERWFAQALSDLNKRGGVFDRHVDGLMKDDDDVLSVVNTGLAGSVLESFSYEYQAMKKELGLILELAAKSEKDGAEWTSLEYRLNDLSLVLLEMMDVFESIAMLPELDLRDGIVDMALNQSDLAAQVNEKKYIELLKPVFQKSPHVYEEVLKLKENGVLFEIFPFLSRIAGFPKRDGSIIIDHLLNLIRHLEWIEKGDRAAFNAGTLGWVVEPKEFQLYQRLFSEASAGEGRELLYLVALLHNIGEISRVEDWKARESFQVRQALLKFDHPEAGGAYLIRPIIRRKLGFSTQVMKDRMKMVEWLILNQFAAGGLFFGEVSPSHLLAKMVAMPAGVDQSKLFKMLTILSFADLRNTYGGAYITQFKTNFYAGMMNFETLWLILQRLDEYRLQRFIAGQDGSPDPQKQIAIDELYGKLPASLQNHLKHVLRYGIHRIHFGAFLFRSVTVETLLKLLMTISAFFKAPGVELRDVAFTTSSAEAEAAADKLDAFFDSLSFQEVGSFFGMDVHKIQSVLAGRGLPVEIREATEELVIDTKALLQFSARSDSKSRAEMRANEIDPETLPESERVRLARQFIKSEGKGEIALADLPAELLQQLFEKYGVQVKKTHKGKSFAYDLVVIREKTKAKPRPKKEAEPDKEKPSPVKPGSEMHRQEILDSIQKLRQEAGSAMNEAQRYQKYQISYALEQYALAAAKLEQAAAEAKEAHEKTTDRAFQNQLQGMISLCTVKAEKAKELQAALDPVSKEKLEAQKRLKALEIEAERIAKEKAAAEKLPRQEEEKAKLEAERIAREEVLRKQREEEARQLIEAQRKEREVQIAKAEFEAQKTRVIKLTEEADARLVALDVKDFTGIKSIREMKEVYSAVKAAEEFRAKYGKDGDLEERFGIFGSFVAAKEADYTQWRQNNEKLLATITRNPAVLLDRIKLAEKKRSRNEPLEPVETRKAVEASFKVIMEAAMADIGSRDTFTKQDAETMGLLKKIQAALDGNEPASRSEVRDGQLSLIFKKKDEEKTPPASKDSLDEALRFRDMTRVRAAQMHRINREMIPLWDAWKTLKEGPSEGEEIDPRGMMLSRIRSYARELEGFAAKIRPDDEAGFAGEKELYERLRQYGKRPGKDIRQDEVSVALKIESDLLKEKIRGLAPGFVAAHKADDDAALNKLNREAVMLYKVRILTQLLQAVSMMREEKPDSNRVLAVLAALETNYIKLSHEYGWKWRRLLRAAGIKKVQAITGSGDISRVFDYGTFRVREGEPGEDGRPSVSVEQIIWVLRKLENDREVYVPELRPINFKDLGAAVRGAVHTILSQEGDYARTFGLVSDIDYAEELLKIYQNTLPGYYREILVDALGDVLHRKRGGLARAKVPGKRVKALSDIETALEKLRSENPAEALPFLESAKRALRERLQEIERKMTGVRSRGDWLEHQFRVEETDRAAKEIYELMKANEFDKALELTRFLYKYHYLMPAPKARDYERVRLFLVPLGKKLKELANIDKSRDYLKKELLSEAHGLRSQVSRANSFQASRLRSGKDARKHSVTARSEVRNLFPEDPLQRDAQEAKRILIVYHTGSGGTKRICDQFKEKLSGRYAVDMVEANSRFDGDLSEYELVLFGFPTFRLAPSPSVVEFIKKLPAVPKPVKVFAFLTKSTVSNNAMRKFAGHLEEKNFILGGSEEFRAPGTDLVLDFSEKFTRWAHKHFNMAFGYEPGILEKIDRSVSVIEELVEAPSVKFRMPRWKLNTLFWAPVQALMFDGMPINIAPLEILSVRCKKCNQCALKFCSRGAWVATGNIPKWLKERCDRCMSCVHQCPFKAIIYDKKMKDSPRLDKNFHDRAEVEYLSEKSHSTHVERGLPEDRASRSEARQSKKTEQKNPLLAKKLQLGSSRSAARSKQSPKAVVFDVGGVIFDHDFEKMAQAFMDAGAQGKSIDEIIDIAIFSDFYKAFEREGKEPEKFHARLCEALGIKSLSYDRFLEIWTDIYKLKTETVDLIQQIRASGAKIFFLSDANPLHIQYLREHYPDVFALAVHVFTSYELGLRKGDGSRVFEAVSEKLEQEYGVKRGEYVFFDDLKDNVDAANSVGFPAVVFTSAQAAQEDLAFLPEEESDHDSSARSEAREDFFGSEMDVSKFKAEEVTPDEIQSDLAKIDLARRGSSKITSIDEAGLLVTGKRQEVSEPWTNRRVRLTYILREGLKPYRDVLPALTDSLKDGAHHGGKNISFSMVSPRFGYAGTSTDYLNYGPSSGKNGYSPYNVAFILDPGYVRRHQEDFHAVGEVFAANGTMHRAYIDPKGNVLGGFTHRPDIAGQITRPAPYPDEVVIGQNIPPEAFGAIIAHDAYAKEIRDIIVTEFPQMSIRIFNPANELLFDIRGNATTVLGAASDGKRSEVRDATHPYAMIADKAVQLLNMPAQDIQKGKRWKVTENDPDRFKCLADHTGDFWVFKHTSPGAEPYAVLLSKPQQEEEGIRSGYVQSNISQAQIYKAINSDGQRKDVPYLYTEETRWIGGRKVTILIMRMFPDGMTMLDALGNGRFNGWTFRQKGRFILSLANTVAYVHQRGIIHHDDGPQNVWIPMALLEDPDSVLDNPPILFDYSAARSFEERLAEGDDIIATEGWSVPARLLNLIPDFYNSNYPDRFGLGVIMAALYGIDRVEKVLSDAARSNGEARPEMYSGGKRYILKRTAGNDDRTRLLNLRKALHAAINSATNLSSGQRSVIESLLNFNPVSNTVLKREGNDLRDISMVSNIRKHFVPPERKTQIMRTQKSTLSDIPQPEKRDVGRSEARSEPTPEETPTAGFSEERRQQLLKSIDHFNQVKNEMDKAQLEAMEKFAINNMKNFSDAKDVSTLRGVLVDVWVRFSKIPGAPSAKMENLSEIQLRAMEEFVIDRLEKSDKTEDISSLMGVLVDIWVRFSKISSVPFAIYEERIRFLVENIFMQERILNDDVHSNDVGLFEKYVRAASASDIVTLENLLKEVAARKPEVNPGGLSEEGLRELRQSIDYRSFLTAGKMDDAIRKRLYGPKRSEARAEVRSGNSDVPIEGESRLSKERRANAIRAKADRMAPEVLDPALKKRWAIKIADSFSTEGLETLVRLYKMHDSHRGIDHLLIADTRMEVKLNSPTLGQLEHLLLVHGLPAEHFKEDGLLDIAPIGGMQALIAALKAPESSSSAAGLGSAIEDLRIRNYEDTKSSERIALRSGDRVKNFIVRGSFHLTDDTTLNLAVDEESGGLYVVRKLLTEDDEDHCAYVPDIMEKLKGYEGVYQAEWMVKADDSKGWSGTDESMNGAIVYPYIPGKDLAHIFEGYKKLPLIEYSGKLLDVVIQVADICAYIEKKDIPGVWSIKPKNIMVTPSGRPVLIDYTRKEINPLSSIEFLLYESIDDIHTKGTDGILPTLKLVPDPALNRQIVVLLTAIHRKIKANSYDNIGQFSEELKGVKALMGAGDGPGSTTLQPQGSVRSEAREKKDLLWTKPALDAKPDPVAGVNRQFIWWTKRTPAWTEEEILKIPKVIKALYDAGINLRGGSIQMDKSEEGKKAVQSVLGTPRTAGAVYAKALQLYKDKGKWPAALREAGIDPAILPIYPGAIEERNMRLAQEERAGKRSEMRAGKSSAKQPSLADLIKSVATAPMRYAGNSIKTDHGAAAFQKLYGMLREDPEAVLSGMAGLSLALLRQFRNSRRGKSLISFFPVLNESQPFQPRSEIREEKYNADWLRNAAFLFNSTDPKLREVLNEVLSDDSEVLTPRQREVLRKQYWEGMTISQIAEEEGKSRNAVSDAAWKAILHLRHYLDEKGYFRLNPSADLKGLLTGKQSRAARSEVRSELSETKEEIRPVEVQSVAEVKKPEEIVPAQENPLPLPQVTMPLAETAKPVDQPQTEKTEVPSPIEPAVVQEIVPAPKIKKTRSQKASAKKKAGDRILSKELAIALLQELEIAFPKNSEEGAEVFLRLYEDNYVKAIEALTWSDPAKAAAKAERLIELIESLPKKTPDMPSRISKRFEVLIATLKWFRDAAKFAGSIEQPTLMDRAVGDDPDLVIDQMTKMIEKIGEGRERFPAPPVGFDRALKAWQDRLLGIQQLAMNSKDEVDAVRSESSDSVNAGKEEDPFTKDQKKDLIREVLEEMGIQEAEMKKLNLVRIFDLCNGPGVEAAEKLNDYFDDRGFSGLADQVDDLISRMKEAMVQENEDEEDPEGNDPGSVRSEARLQQVYAGVLGTVLRQNPAREDVVLEFTEEVRAAGVEPVTRGLWAAFNNIVLPEAMAEMVSRADVFAIGMEESMSFRAAHLGYESKLSVVARESVAQMEKDARVYLKQDPKNSLHFAFAMPLQSGDASALSDWLLDYLRAIQALKTAFGDRVHGDIRILARRAQMDDAFVKAVQRSGFAKIVEMDQNAGREINKFLNECRNAMVFDLPEALNGEIGPENMERMVRLERVMWSDVYPIATPISFQAAQVSQITADLLNKIPQVLPGNAVAFRNGQLVILETVRQLILEAQAGQLFAQMA